MRGKEIMQEAIKIENLTKNYKNGHGIFDINISVNKGEVFGYLGPNGAGKSTTIRHILGFIKANKGSVKIGGLDAWKDANKVNASLGYIPGEIAMPEFMTGTEFIKYIYNLRKLKNWNEVEEMIKFWEFDPNVKIKRMSKGMKQKVGLVCAFMHNPDYLILDEPTSGLDPLMQDKFVSLIQKSQAEGKTIIMSSHIFQEIEKTCDRVAVIKNGRIISQVDMKAITYHEEKTFDVQFINENDYRNVSIPNAQIIERNDKWKSVIFQIKSADINAFVKTISKYDLAYLKEIPFTLEEYFMKFYGSDDSIDIKPNKKAKKENGGNN
jgi:ABC-2 type transport system ATP-binding protein